MKTAWSLVVVSLLVVPAVAGQNAGRARPEPLEVGDRIPSFHAVDQHGKDRAFADLAGPKGLVIFFYKSADW